MKVKVLLIIFGLLAIFGGMMAQEATPETEPAADLRFFLSYIPNIQFAPIYVAIGSGYFADEGINLVIEHGDENIGVEQIALNDIQFGIVGGDQVLLARAGERPVVQVYQWFQSYPVGIVIPSTTEAETVQDLAGKRVGLPGRFGVNYIGLNAILAANDMTEADIELQEIGYVAPDVVCAGNVDASVIYVNNEPLEIQRRAEAGECGDITGVSVIRVADYANMVNNGIITNEETLANQPELVAAVVNAFDQGLADTINNPAKAYLLSAELVENLPLSDKLRAELETAAAEQDEFLATNPDPEAIAASRDDLYTQLALNFDAQDIQQLLVLLESIKLWEGETLGYSDPAAWETTQQVLTDMNLLAAPVDLEKAFTNDFVQDES